MEPRCSSFFTCADPTAAALDGVQQVEHRLERIRLTRGLVPADAADPGKAHGDARFVPRRALKSLEGDLQHQAEIPFGADRANGAEPIGGMVAYEFVDLFQFLVGEAEIGLADWRQRTAFRGPAGRTSALRR